MLELKLPHWAGYLSLFLIFFALSRQKRQIQWRVVGSAIVLQVIVVLMVFHTTWGAWIFQAIGGLLESLLKIINSEGQKLLGPAAKDFSFLFTIGTVIAMFTVFGSILYYLRVLQVVAYGLSCLLVKIVKVDGTAALSMILDLWAGPQEVFAMLKGLLAKASRAQLLTIMSSGLATLAGGVMAAFTGMLSGTMENVAAHLLLASVLNILSCVVLCSLIMPVEVDKRNEPLVLDRNRGAASLQEALTNGVTTALKLVGIIVLTLMFMNVVLEIANQLWSWGAGKTSSSLGLDLSAVDSFSKFLGWLFAIPAFLCGVPLGECHIAGTLLAERSLLNEFVAYGHLGSQTNLSANTKLILLYALSSFANLATTVMQAQVLTALLPERAADVRAITWLALLVATVATMLSANMVMMISSF